MYFTIMAPVDMKSVNCTQRNPPKPFNPKCVSYFRRKNQSYFNCLVCKSFAGLPTPVIATISLGNGSRPVTAWFL